ncbi:MAG: AI-2E family transporter [Anaerolineales bacterium]|nr:AI-2E family transporter [Anaerolineales bacterium]MCA9930328.1 AI-2E family transporter [Anaerolineales bacterium]
MMTKPDPSDSTQSPVENQPITISADPKSPPWSRSTKTIVTVAALLFFLWLSYRFQSLIGQIVFAAILAYILNPFINLIDRNTPFKRSTGILIAYFVLAVGVLGAITALGFAAVEQISNLIQQIPDFITETTLLIQETYQNLQPISFGPFQFNPVEFDLSVLTDQVIGLIEPVLSHSGQIITDVATTAVGLVGILLFVFVISIYIAIEIPQLSGYVGRVAHQPGYRRDAERLMREFGRIWSAYLRGQVILGVIIFLVVWAGLAILGVQNALALGILSGLLEFIPVLGPVVGAGTAMVVAFFQPDNYMGLSAVAHTGVVLAFMILVQQLENNILVPRIVGEALDLHPLIVMVAVFMGSSLAGILGAILAAPVVATLKLISVYAWRKMFDLPPFPQPEKEGPPDSPAIRERMSQLTARIKTAVSSRPTDSQDSH